MYILSCLNSFKQIWGFNDLWLCRAALDLILTQGYLPNSDNEWVTLVALLLLKEEDELSTKFIADLPKKINSFAFKEWVSILEY